MSSSRAKVHAGSDQPGRGAGDEPWPAGAAPMLALARSGVAARAAHCCCSAPLAPARPGSRRLPTADRAARGHRHRSARRCRSPIRSGWPRVTTAAAAATDLTVYPHGRRRSCRSSRRRVTIRTRAPSIRTPSAAAGEDFYALRPYVVGDDLRRVHWPSTARHDELMVRQDELPWQGRATVLLDVRRGARTPRVLELAVSAAASIVTACWRRRDLARLLATDGTDSGFAAGHPHVEAIMEYLAMVSLSGTASMRSVIESLAAQRRGRRRSRGGRRERCRPRRWTRSFALRRRFSSVTVVAFGDRPKSEPRMGSRDGSSSVHRRRQGLRPSPTSGIWP